MQQNLISLKVLYMQILFSESCGRDAGNFFEGLGKEAPGSEIELITDVLYAHISCKQQGF